ncbi:MAG: cytochrome-c peroxidase [Bacteroidia bacterium]
MKKFLLTASIYMLVVIACTKKESSNLNTEVYQPTALAISYPAWVDVYLSKMPIPADNPTTVEGVALGRKLFYDTKLSDNLTQSCASCHQQNHAFTDSAAFSIGTNGAKGGRNAMQIINLAWSKYLFWDGRRINLEGQAHDPVTNPIEMRNTWPTVVNRLQNDAEYPNLFFKAFGTKNIDSNLVVKAIAQFERTLISFNSKFDKFYFEGDTTVFNDSEKRGLTLFFGKADCNHCHSDVLLSDDALRNNGLDLTFKDKGRGEVTKNASDDGKFKVPTLRNIEVTGPYMHDSRFKTLEEVVNHYNEGVVKNSPNIDENMEIINKGLNLNQQEKADLVAFMKTLTDHEFLNNSKLSKP